MCVSTVKSYGLLVLLLSGMSATQVDASPYEYYEMAAIAAKEKGLEVPLVLAMIKQESGANSQAVSSKGAVGLMQVMGATAGEFGIKREQLFDPAVNISVGIDYLQVMIKRFNGNLLLALAAYNSGPGNVDRERNGRWLPENYIRMRIRETRDYVLKVFFYRNLLLSCKAAMSLKQCLKSNNIL